MAMGKMPRSFWSYTAGKGDVDAEEFQQKWEGRIQAFKETMPGLLGFGVVMLLMLVMLLMMFAEFRGCDLFQISCLINNIPLIDLLRPSA